MPLIIDTCVFTKIFTKSSKRSNSYERIHDWIFSNKSKIVKGGSKYEEELSRASRFIPTFVELNKKNRVLNLNNNEVDKLAKDILLLETDPDLDDEHIIAMAIISKAKGVCTADERAERFIKDKKFYPIGTKKPKILKETTPETAVTSILNNC